MQVSRIEYSRLGSWSHTDLAYIQHASNLNPFLSYTPGLDAMSEVIRQRKKFPVDRALLLRVLKKQYQKLGIELPFAEESLLSENTFTVTTSHQPVLFTGPLFHIYKIASTINLAKSLQSLNPDHQFIPVFVLGGEDHDWSEINHLHLFGRKLSWDRTSSGPVGRLSTEGLDTLIHSIQEMLSNTPHGKEIIELLSACLQKATDYGEFHQLLIHGLFNRHGLVVIDTDDPDLKRSFIPLMEREVQDQFSFQYVSATQAALEKEGYKPQAYCRPINLFYMSDQRRERIDPAEGGYVRVETRIKYSREELLSEIQNHPECFSPNVILRPLYQETILPNLAFVGGGGEIAYWLERKSQFEAAGVHHPMLIRRNSLLLIDNTTINQLKKADLAWEDLLPHYSSIVKKYLHSHSQADLHLDGETKMIQEAYQSLAQKAEKLDPTLSKAILAEETKQIKQFEQLGTRLFRAEKQLQENNLKRIQKLKEKLFPEGGLQERYENFLPYYAMNGQQWIDDMVALCNPIEEKFTVVELKA